MKKGKRGGLVSGITLFTIGLVFLLDNLGFIDVSIVWPIILIGIGLAITIQHYLNRKDRIRKK
jgi:hypothetical protein